MGLSFEHVATKPTVRIEKITPSRARSMLADVNVDNRKLRRQRVRGYAEQMTRGEWKVSGDAIRFDREGRLIDGQHRLAAAAEANYTLETVVVYDVEPDAYKVIDSGLSRNPGDAVTHAGLPGGAVMAAMLRTIIAIERGLNLWDSNALWLISRSELVEHGLAHEEEASVAMRLAWVVEPRVGGTHRSWGTWAYFANRVHPRLVEMFTDAVVNGVDLKAGDPRLAFRNWLTSRRRLRHGRDSTVVLGSLIRTWNYWMANRDLALIRPITASSPWPEVHQPGRTRWGELRAEGLVSGRAPANDDMAEEEEEPEVMEA